MHKKYKKNPHALKYRGIWVKKFNKYNIETNLITISNINTLDRYYFYVLLILTIVYDIFKFSYLL